MILIEKNDKKEELIRINKTDYIKNFYGDKVAFEFLEIPNNYGYDFCVKIVIDKEKFYIHNFYCFKTDEEAEYFYDNLVDFENLFKEKDYFYIQDIIKKELFFYYDIKQK